VSFPPNNPRLIASLKKTFADLATPLDLSIRNVWRGADRPPDGKWCSLIICFPSPDDS